MRTRTGAVFVLAAALVATACGTAGEETGRPAPKTTARPLVDVPPEREEREHVSVVAVGDIACRTIAPGCYHDETSNLVEPGTEVVLVLGDTQYPDGRIEQYLESYDPTWGRWKELTYPVIGNHEILSGGEGFFEYFAEVETWPEVRGSFKEGFYAFEAGTWLIVVVNSNCHGERCEPGSAQMAWLERTLQRSPSCTMMAWHHPRWSSGEHGDDERVREIWASAVRHRVDVSVHGHDHHYERFARLDDRGEVSTGGVRSFVIGTGGRDLNPVAGRRHGSENAIDDEFGVAAFDLEQDGYAWRFTGVDGSVHDSGSETCR